MRRTSLDIRPGIFATIGYGRSSSMSMEGVGGSDQHGRVGTGEGDGGAMLGH